MPTNFGALPTDKPLLPSRVQIKRGAAGTYHNVDTSTPGGTKIIDGAGGYMEISYTPTYPCLWIVRSNLMACGYIDGAGWRRWDHSIYCTPADADGLGQGFQCPHQLYDNNTVSWRSVTGSFRFRLAAGITYTAYLAHSYISGGGAHIHVGPEWARIVGVVVGEGFI